MNSVLSHIIVHTENMQRNIEHMQGLTLAEHVMIELCRRGMNRADAHEIVRQCSMEAQTKNVPLKHLLLKHPEVKISENEIENLMKPENYLGATQQIIENIVQRLRGNTTGME